MYSHFQLNATVVCLMINIDPFTFSNNTDALSVLNFRLIFFVTFSCCCHIVTETHSETCNETDTEESKMTFSNVSKNIII